MPARGLELTVRFRDGAIFVQATGQPEAKALRQSNGEFRASFDPDVRIVFETGDSSPGFTLYQAGEMKFERVE